jgi:hypothetical protein
MDIIDKIIKDTTKELDEISMEFATIQTNDTANGVLHKDARTKEVMKKAISLSFKLSVLSGVANNDK